MMYSVKSLSLFKCSRGTSSRTSIPVDFRPAILWFISKRYSYTSSIPSLFHLQIIYLKIHKTVFKDGTALNVNLFVISQVFSVKEFEPD